MTNLIHVFCAEGDGGIHGLHDLGVAPLGSGRHFTQEPLLVQVGLLLLLGLRLVVEGLPLVAGGFLGAGFVLDAAGLLQLPVVDPEGLLEPGAGIGKRPRHFNRPVRTGTDSGAVRQDEGLAVREGVSRTRGLQGPVRGMRL